MEKQSRRMAQPMKRFEISTLYTNIAYMPERGPGDKRGKLAALSGLVTYFNDK